MISLWGGMACTPGDRGAQQPSQAAKQRLNEYLVHSFQVKDPKERAQLGSYLTGDARSRLLAWSDEQFRAAFIETQRKLVEIKFRETQVISPTEVSLTYELTTVDQSRGKNARVTQKKLCRMILSQGVWLIQSVQNIKELVEYQNEMSLP